MRITINYVPQVATILLPVFAGPSISVLMIESASKRPGVMLENYYRELVCFLNAKLGNRQVAEDVVHDAYVRVLERSATRRSSSPGPFFIARR